MKLHLTQLTGAFVTFDRTINETPGVVTFRFKPQPNVRWEAGQYYVYFMPGDLLDPRSPFRPFTVSSAPSEGYLQITTRIVAAPSHFKQLLLSLKPGDKVYTVGPFGFFTLNPSRGPFVWLAGGIGITPFRSQLVELAKSGPLPDITLIYSNRDNNVLFRQELDALAVAHVKLKIHYLIGDQHVDAAVIKAVVNQPQTPIYYLSGPKPMVKSLSAILQTELNVSTNHIKHDAFKGYPWPLL